MADSNAMFLDMFSDRERISNYLDGPRRFTPGLDAVHQYACEADTSVSKNMTFRHERHADRHPNPFAEIKR